MTESITCHDCGAAPSWRTSWGEFDEHDNWRCLPCVEKRILA